jgi:hypothetical protein
MSNVEAIKTRALSSTATIDYDNLIASKHANNMPMIDGKPRNDLKEDIEKKGILTKIVLYKGEILDGRNRYSCGKEIGYAFSVSGRASQVVQKSRKRTSSLLGSFIFCFT